MSDLKQTLAEMLAVCEQNELLKKQVDELQSQISKHEQQKQTIDPSVSRIDQIMTDLAHSMDVTAEPVSSLVRASVCVLEAARTLLEACRHKMS